MPSFIDMLKISVSGTLNSAASFLMINIEKPSWPVLFLASKFLITSKLEPSVIGLKNMVLSVDLDK